MATADRQGDIQKFKLRKKDVIKLESSTATVVFKSIDSDLVNVAYRFEDSFVVDTDIFSNQTLFSKEGVRVVYDATANSKSIEDADLMVKVWNSGTNFSISEQGSGLDLRQTTSSNESNHVVSVSNSMKSFDPVIVESISYYPKISMEVSLKTLYNSEYSVSNFIVEPGSSTEFEIIDGDNYGVSNLVFNYILSWYLDVDRTILTSSPELPEVSDESSYVRVFYHEAGKFSNAGITRDDGVSIFSGIVNSEFVLRTGSEYGDLLYLASEDGILKSFVEEEITIEVNGFPIQDGNTSSNYILGSF